MKVDVIGAVDASTGLENSFEDMDGDGFASDERGCNDKGPSTTSMDAETWYDGFDQNVVGKMTKTVMVMSDVYLH